MWERAWMLLMMIVAIETGWNIRVGDEKKGIVKHLIFMCCYSYECSILLSYLMFIYIYRVLVNKTVDKILQHMIKTIHICGNIQCTLILEFYVNAFMCRHFYWEIMVQDIYLQMVLTMFLKHAVSLNMNRKSWESFCLFPKDQMIFTDLILLLRYFALIPKDSFTHSVKAHASYNINNNNNQ